MLGIGGKGGVVDHFLRRFRSRCIARIGLFAFFQVEFYRHFAELKLIAKYATVRAELRKKLKDPNVSIEEKLEVQVAFARLPRNSCPTRKNNRGAISGRSKAFYNKFGISRIALRALALRDQLPGVRKSSW